MHLIMNSDGTTGIDLYVIKNLIAEIIDWLERFLFILPVIVTIIAFFLTLILFSKRCNRISNNQIREYSTVGKYIRGLFVELNESKEYLRAFCFSHLWRKKLIRKYNTLFNDKKGKVFLNVYSEKAVNLHLPLNCCTEKLRREIEKTNIFLGKVERRELVCNPDYTKTNLIYECFGRTYANVIEQIDKTASFLGKKYLIVTGTAGNGKSMMLCSIAEQLVKRKETVLFLNARDIKDDLIAYIVKQGIYQKSEKYPYAWWKFQGVLHFILRKNIYIIIDAINENTTEAFLESIANHVERLLESPHIKVIISCRSEYFDVKYKKHLITCNLEQKVCLIDLQEDKYTYEAKERLLSNYANHYGFTGELSDNVKEKLTRQLLLVRIFFELYANQSDNVFELNKFELYKKYIDSIDNPDLKEIIHKLTTYMFDNKQFVNIPLAKISQDANRYELIDSSVLICRTIISDKGKLYEDSKEVINFVYDEMRDYHLTRHLLSVCRDKNESIDYSKVKTHVRSLVKQNAQCLEGVTNYLFCHCITENISSLINYLLFELIKLRDDQIDPFLNRNNRHINSWGLALLFETDSINTFFGEKYVDYILQDNPGKEAQKLLVYLLNQEATNGKFTLDILINSFLRAENARKLRTRVCNTIADWEGHGVTIYQLIDIHKNLKKKNKIGAERFIIYSLMLINNVEFKNKSKIQEYFIKENNESTVKYETRIRRK